MNPAHLEAVTHAENTRRGGAAKTHCIRGHLYDEANTGYQRKGTRVCRKCRTRRAECPVCGLERSHFNLPEHIRVMHPEAE